MLSFNLNEAVETGVDSIVSGGTFGDSLEASAASINPILGEVVGWVNNMFRGQNFEQDVKEGALKKINGIVNNAKRYLDDTSKPESERLKLLDAYLNAEISWTVHWFNYHQHPAWRQGESFIKKALQDFLQSVRSEASSRYVLTAKKGDVSSFGLTAVNDVVMNFDVISKFQNYSEYTLKGTLPKSSSVNNTVTSLPQSSSKPLDLVSTSDSVVNGLQNQEEKTNYLGLIIGVVVAVLGATIYLFKKKR